MAETFAIGFLAGAVVMLVATRRSIYAWRKRVEKAIGGVE